MSVKLKHHLKPGEVLTLRALRKRALKRFPDADPEIVKARLDQRIAAQLRSKARPLYRKGRGAAAKYSWSPFPEDPPPPPPPPSDDGDGNSDSNTDADDNNDNDNDNNAGAN